MLEHVGFIFSIYIEKKDLTEFNEVNSLKK